MNSEGNTESKDMVVPEVKHSKGSVIKNLIIISTAAMLLFTSSRSMDNLQSSIRIEDHLGVATLSVVSAVNMAGCLFFSAWFVKKFGPKVGLLLTMVCYVAYNAANFYGQWYTLMPVAVVLGIANSVLYASLWTYVGNLVHRYVELTSSGTDVVNAVFFGTINTFLQTAVIWGGIVSFKVLNGDDTVISPHNYQPCGVNFCDSNVPEDSEQFSGIPDNFYLLCGIFLALSVSAIIVTSFLELQTPNQEDVKSLREGLLETLKKIPNTNMLLLVPITVYAGFSVSYVGGELTKAYITCPWGVAYVGYVMACFGVTSTIFSFVLGWMVKVLDRRIVFLIGAILDLFVYASLTWCPHAASTFPLIILFLTGVLGITNGVWQGQLKGLFGSLFPDCPEVAFSLLGLFECLGQTVAYGYSGVLCTVPKLIILTVTLVIGMFCYAVIEIRVRQKSSK